LPRHTSAAKHICQRVPYVRAIRSSRLTLPHELGRVDLGPGGDNLGLSDTLLGSSRRERLLELNGEVDVLEKDRLDGDTPLLGGGLDLDGSVETPAPVHTQAAGCEIARGKLGGDAGDLGRSEEEDRQSGKEEQPTISATSWARPSRSEMTLWRTCTGVRSRSVANAGVASDSHVHQRPDAGWSLG
jgi:hypothetical protein